MEPEVPQSEAGSGGMEELKVSTEAEGDVMQSYSKMAEKAAALRTELAKGRSKSRAAMESTNGAADMEARMRAQIKTLKDDLERRQASYVRREREFRAKIADLEGNLHKVKSDRKQAVDTVEQMDSVRGMHNDILKNIEHVQEQTARILSEQERDLLRAFRARLFDVQTELEKQKTRSGEGAAVWIEKNRQLEKELDWAKEMADRLDRHNQAYIRENNRLKAQFKTQEDDREYLIKQLVAAKKDNTRLRQELTGTKTELANVRSGLGSTDAGGSAATTGGFTQQGTARSGGMGGSSGAAGYGKAPNVEAENRYKDVIRRLKRLLETERKNLRQVRTQFANELQQRSELEIFLRQCVEDVKQDIQRRRKQLAASTSSVSLPPVGSRPGTADSKVADDADGETNVPLKTFMPADRERVMELLLSQERVISLLYSRTFPLRTSAATTAAGDADVGTTTGSRARAAAAEEADVRRMLEERHGAE